MLHKVNVKKIIRPGKHFKEWMANRHKNNNLIREIRTTKPLYKSQPISTYAYRRPLNLRQSLTYKSAVTPYELSDSPLYKRISREYIEKTTKRPSKKDKHKKFVKARDQDVKIDANYKYFALISSREGSHSKKNESLIDKKPQSDEFNPRHPDGYKPVPITYSDDGYVVNTPSEDRNVAITYLEDADTDTKISDENNIEKSY